MVSYDSMSRNAADVDEVEILDNIGIYGTYYTGEYEICEAARKVKTADGHVVEHQEECRKGLMHAAVVFRGMVFDSFTKLFLLLCLELPEGSRLNLFNSSRYGTNSFKNDRRVYMGFSGLESTGRIDSFYMSGLSAVMGPFTSRAPLKEYWPAEALKLDYWNEYAGKASGPVCSFNTFIRQPIPRLNQVSLRRLDEIYVVGIRRFLLKDLEHMAKYDSSTFNIFNALYGDPTPPTSSVAEDVSDSSTTPVSTHSSGDASKVESDPTLFDTINGTLRSTDCGVTIKFTGKERDMSYMDTMAYNFSTGFIIKVVIETYILLKQAKKVDEGAQGQTMSIIAFTMYSYQDWLEIFMLIFHRGVFWKNVTSFCFMFLMKLFLVGVIDHTFLVLIWRANHAAQIREGWEATQKRFSLFYRYYFSFLFLKCFLWYFYYVESPWIFVVTYLCWVPQILLDAWRGHCTPFSFLSIVVLSICRMYMPYYVFMLKESAFTYDVFALDSGRTNRTVGAYIMLVTFLQLILMSLQRLNGARCFASWSILPQIYTYVRPWSQLMQDDPQECVICMYSIVHSKR
ncbi:zinc finger containing protein [Babesia ovata]|uniref:RING-type E3 ubiquitin transferase n=1 Tax=Babesia ovata TaxID=189622 RepID=A0A2H6K8F8_9APIC|nr:zinc finger containing protein [Babesia ovata]GBE59292.1 zinc finger containing protein [Babesia ovata]